MKEKIYLDTNIIYGYFLQKAKELKGGKFKEPKIIENLRRGKKYFKYFTSTLTKSEVFRRLRTELKVKEEEINNLWIKFIAHLNITELKLTEISFEKVLEDITEIVKKTEIKKRVTNLQHLSIAKTFGFKFLTGDKEILEKCKQFYPNIISYVDFIKYYLNILMRKENYEEINTNRKNNNTKWEKGKSFGTIPKGK
ncbi:MAG: PIN domain-containing protein [Candidatus Aenigmatarchaeota archaeon]